MCRSCRSLPHSLQSGESTQEQSDRVCVSAAPSSLSRHQVAPANIHRPRDERALRPLATDGRRRLPRRGPAGRRDSPRGEGRVVGDGEAVLHAGDGGVRGPEDEGEARRQVREPLEGDALRRRRRRQQRRREGRRGYRTARGPAAAAPARIAAAMRRCSCSCTPLTAAASAVYPSPSLILLRRTQCWRAGAHLAACATSSPLPPPPTLPHFPPPPHDYRREHTWRHTSQSRVESSP